MKSRTDVLIYTENDNVGTAVVKLAPEDTFFADHYGHRKAKILGKVPFGFKVALVDIAKGGKIIKYGEVIGISTQPIRTGEMVHVHNIAGTRGRGDLASGGGNRG